MPEVSFIKGRIQNTVCFDHKSEGELYSNDQNLDPVSVSRMRSIQHLGAGTTEPGLRLVHHTEARLEQPSRRRLHPGRADAAVCNRSGCTPISDLLQPVSSRELWNQVETG